MAKKAKKRSKKTATSESGRKYERSSKSKTGWVEVHAYRRTKPTRHGGAAAKAARFCRDTRRKKVTRVKRRK